MKKAQKEKITALCEKLDLSNYWTNTIIEMYNSQMSGRRCIVASVKSVSSSGMSRKLKFGMVRRSGEFEDITHLICKIYGCKMTKDYCLSVQGCGMDMIFSVLNTVYYRIALKEDFSNYDNFCRYTMF